MRPLPATVLLAAAVALIQPQAAAREVTDLAGRTVAIPDHVERVVLGEGRFLPALAILDRDNPVSRLVGTLGDFARFDPAGYAQYRDRFPELADVVEVGLASGGGFSVEKTIALQPDLAIFGLSGHGPSVKSEEVIRPLEAAGIAVLFIDFRTQPIENTPRSIELLGEVLGRQAEAADFVAYYHEQLARVDAAVAHSETRPTVFVESRVGLREECCETMARAMIARFVDRAGGINIGDSLVPGAAGLVSLEQLLVAQPDVYIATAIGAPQHAERFPGRIMLGAGVERAPAQQSFKNVLARPGISDLEAVRGKRAHAIWHHFYNSPFNIVGVQAIAKWLHPELFADIDPHATLATMYQRFQPFDANGIYWMSAP